MSDGGANMFSLLTHQHIVARSGSHLRPVLDIGFQSLPLGLHWGSVVNMRDPD